MTFLQKKSSRPSSSLAMKLLCSASCAAAGRRLDWRWGRKSRGQVC